MPTHQAQHQRHNHYYRMSTTMSDSGSGAQYGSSFSGVPATSSWKHGSHAPMEDQSLYNHQYAHPHQEEAHLNTQWLATSQTKRPLIAVSTCTNENLPNLPTDHDDDCSRAWKRMKVSPHIDTHPNPSVLHHTITDMSSHSFQCPENDKRQHKMALARSVTNEEFHSNTAPNGTISNPQHTVVSVDHALQSQQKQHHVHADVQQEYHGYQQVNSLLGQLHQQRLQHQRQRTVPTPSVGTHDGRSNIGSNNLASYQRARQGPRTVKLRCDSKLA